MEAFRETLGEFDPQRVHFMVCQHQDDEVEAGVEHLHQLYEVMRQDKRQPGKLSELKFGLECGGSDGLSGITANPMLGRFSDYVIANGGTTVLTEVPEMFGAEQLLMSHCRDEATFDKLVTMVNDFKQYFIAHDQPIYENPSPGNKAGGITTLEDKSLGCTQKAGSSRGGCSALRRAPEGSWSEFTERAGQRRGRHQRAGRRRLPYGAVQHRSRHAVRRLCANGEDRHQ